MVLNKREKTTARGARVNQRGVILAITTIGMVSFVMAVGMAVDISHMYTAAAELQNAADAAALAGASALNGSAVGITKAADRAVVAMNKYDVNSTAVTITRTDVRFATNITQFDNGGTGVSEATATSSPANVRFVKVSIPNKPVGIFLTKNVMGNPVNLTKAAVAGQSVGLNEVCNPSGLFITQDDVNHDDLDRTDTTCGSNWQYTPGCTYNLHLTPPCDVVASNYFVHNIETTRVANQWNKRIAVGLDGCYTPNQQVQTEPHPNGQAVRQAINSRFGTYNGGLTAADFPPDLNVTNNLTWAQYLANSPTTAPPVGVGVPDRRVLILPIVNASTWNSSTFKVNLAKYGAFFLTKKATGSNTSTANLQVYYIGDNVVIGDGAYNPSGSTTVAGNLAVPVLYR